MSHPIDAITGILHPAVKAYLAELGARSGSAGGDPMDPDEAALHARLEAHAIERGFPLVGSASGRWLELLTRMIGGRRVFELGSGFGYSAFWFARGVGSGGQVLGSEKDAWELESFDRLWEDHPLRRRVEIRNQGAFEALAATTGHFDVIFVDIAKKDYPAALQAAIPRLRRGGLLLADNVLWGGKTATEPPADDASGTADLRLFNEQIHADARLQSLILPVGDGLSLSLKLVD